MHLDGMQYIGILVPSRLTMAGPSRWAALGGYGLCRCNGVKYFTH